MSDEVEIRIAGNLRCDVRIEQCAGETVAVTQICAARSVIVEGALVEQMTCLTIELIGAVHAYAFARQHRKGSRVILRGHLEERVMVDTRRLPRADGAGEVAVLLERREHVVIVERLLHIDAAGSTIHQHQVALESPSPRADNTPAVTRLARAPWEWSG